MRSWGLVLLPGEGSPYNVYIIEWEDGAAYVGMTGGAVKERVDRHFEGIDIGEGVYEFVWRHEAGIAYSVKCLHTNLDRHTAEAVERQEIRGRKRLLNIVHNKSFLFSGIKNS